MELAVFAVLGAGIAIFAFALGRWSGRRATAADAGLADQLAAAKAAQERAERDARAKTVLLSRMSHELRTPLTTIVGFSDVVQSELFGPLSPRYRDYVRGIMRSSDSLSRLLADVLDLCAIEAGDLQLCDEVVQPRDIVAACMQLCRERAMRRGCSLSFDTDPSLPGLRADPRRLKQILLNLLDNALERSGEGAKVTVAAMRSEEGLVFRIADDGIAPPASPALAFGLDLARSLVELHGGRLRLLDTVGGGLTAEVVMPEERLTTTEAVAASAAG